VKAAKKQKLSRKDAEPQRYRKEKLCGFFASSRLCVRLFLFGSGLSCEYLKENDHKELREHYDHIGGMLVNTMNNPEKWCKSVRRA